MASKVVTKQSVSGIEIMHNVKLLLFAQEYFDLIKLILLVLVPDPDQSIEDCRLHLLDGLTEAEKNRLKSLMYDLL